MTVAEALQGIESERFAALTNLASNVKTFLRIAADQPETQALLVILANNPPAASQVSRRALELSAMPAADPGHEHPADAALAVYLWLLGSHPSETCPVAAAILKDARTFFWARKLAERCPAPTCPVTWDGAPVKSTTNGTATADNRASRRES